MKHRRVLRWALVLMLGAMLLAGAACSDGDDGDDDSLPDGVGPTIAETSSVSIHDAFIPVPAADIGALYLTMVDRDGEGDRLLGVTTAAAGMTHLHSTVTEGDTSRMLPVEGGIVVPPNGMNTLEPGALHAMLMNLAGPLAEGDTVEVTLQFERSEPITLQVPVRSYDDAE